MTSNKFLEFSLFRNYTAEVKKFLKETLYLSNYPDDFNVTVFWSSPTRTFANYIFPTLNGGTLNPTCSFVLSGQTYSKDQSPGGYYKTYKRIDNSDEFREMRTPIPFSLTYRVTLWTNTQIEMDILLWQLNNAAPFNRKHASIVDGQWCEISVSSDAQKESDTEPGILDSAPFRYGIDINIPRAYLPMDYINYKGVIKEVDLAIDYDVFPEIKKDIKNDNVYGEVKVLDGGGPGSIEEETEIDGGGVI